jgi:hypothetical protein
MNIPTIADVERITAIPDTVVRNLNITQCYYELSKAMEELIGINPNWCTFAVWASKQAGQSIRREDITRTYEYYFRHSPEIKSILKNISLIRLLKNLPEVKTIIDSILRVINVDNIFETSALAVANGNRKVFEEIGREFARFLAVFRSENDFTQEKINEFCATLKPGEPPNGQRLLRDAFTAYYEAKFVSDSKTKTEIVHYANLLIGFHEQTRLQPEIFEAMTAPLENTNDLRYKIFKQFLPDTWLHIRYFLSKVFKIKFPLDELLDQLIDLMKQQAREVITRFMMSLYIPGCPVLRLGENLNRAFPAQLLQISNENLKELLLKVDPTPDDLKDSGAKDWGNFEDRIHFIADFFRCYHDYAALFDSPFSEDQVTILKQGKRPPGIL